MGGANSKRYKTMFLNDRCETSQGLSKNRYNISHKLIGKGAFAKVYKGRMSSNPSLKLAFKRFKKQLFDSENKAVEEEAKILSMLDHPNIVKFYDAFEDDKYLYIVTEFIKGETLAQWLTKRQQPMSEADAAHVLHQLASAVNHCHMNSVAHRDIKLDNVMIDDELNVTIIDFGLAKIFSKSNQLKSRVGSPLFMAPEVSEGKYTEKCDVWSLGVLMYVLLSCRLPFSGNELAEVLLQSKQCDLALGSDFWSTTSADAKDLLQSMIAVSTKERISCQQVLSHEWFSLARDDTTDDSFENKEENVLEALKNFKCDSKLRKMILYLLAKMIDVKPSRSVCQEFNKLNAKCNGVLSKEELRNAFDKCQSNVTDEELGNIINNLDFSGDQQINFTEYLVATLSESKLCQKKNIETLFCKFDRDGDGIILKEDIAREFKLINQPLSKTELKKILKPYDSQKNGYITYEDFEGIVMSS